VVELFAKSGADAWYAAESDNLAARAKCECGAAAAGESGGESFKKEADILDVWFESGCSYLVETANEANQPWPSDLYLEGGDQYRGWFMSSLLCAIGAKGSAPYKSCATPGWTLDEQGRAMSKSRGNDVDPVDIANRLGGEIVRLWVASVDFREDVVGSEGLMQRVAENYRKIRNTFRYILSNLYDFDPARDAVAHEEMQALDQFMLRQMGTLNRQVAEWYDAFAFHRIYHRVTEFCVVDLSSFYFDILKDRLYTFGAKSRERRAAQTALWTIGEALARLLAPIMSFTCDEIWGQLPAAGARPESVHLDRFWTGEQIAGKLFAAAGWEKSDEEWGKLQEVRSVVLKALEEARNNKLIGGNLEAQVRLSAPDPLYALLEKYKPELRYLFIVSHVGLEPGSGELKVEVSKADGLKCERCWNYSTRVGEDAKYPTVCERCAPVLREMGFEPPPGS
jgi:isoleucyl-tRNA synthetase